MTTLPRPARWLLRLTPVPRITRDEVQADLGELFTVRRRDRGAVHAHWRLYRDLASLWLHRGPAAPGGESAARPALLHDVAADLRHAARLFARQPASLLLAVAGLALGLGIATAAFSVMNAAALRGEGLADPDRAPGILRTAGRSVWTTWTYDEFLRLRDGATRLQVEAVLTELATARVDASGTDLPPASVAFVSGGFFAATGGRTALGRTLERADERHTGPPPAVVSHAFWTSRLGRDPSVVGRLIRIGRTEATIVGVAERGFSLPNSRLLWMPLTAYGAVYGPGAPTRAPEAGLQVFGRLLPDASLAEAEAQLGGVAASLPGAPAGDALRVRLDPHAGLGRAAAGETLAIALFVFAVIALVLVLSCANVATVLVSTAIAREREMGVRAALGASRWRIVRQLLTESLAVGTIAALLGLLLAAWALPAIGALVEASPGTDLAPDVTVYIFLAIVTLVTSVLAGLAPARHGRGADLLAPLKGEGASPNRAAPRRLRSALVATQAAISVLLIVMAALFVRATFRAAALDTGFDPAGLYVVSSGSDDALPDPGSARFRQRAAAELRGMPGIAAVTIAEITPFDGMTRTSVTREDPARVVYFNSTRPDYFEALGLRLLTGRVYTGEEASAGAPVAVISQSLARAWWPDRSPLGETLPASIPVASTPPVIIGVVSDAITANLHDRGVLAVYEPLTAGREPLARVIVRVAPGTTGVLDRAVHRLRALDPDADVRIASVAARLQQESGRPRLLAMLTGVVGVVAIVLCVIGLYGLTASVVGQRAREMGVRVALGARRADLLQLLMWDSLRPVIVGLAAGAGAALLVGRVVASTMLFGVSPRDPVAFAGAAGVLLAAATLAVLAPARRAAATDAALVLRR